MQGKDMRIQDKVVMQGEGKGNIDE